MPNRTSIKGGAESYTFDLVWRERGFGRGPTGQILGDRDREASLRDSVHACEDAVRETANQQYKLRDINFRRMNADDNPGRRDRIKGSFDARRGNNRDTYSFSCAINLANGRVHAVEIFRGRDSARNGRYDNGTEVTSACQSAAEQRILRDGYRDVQFARFDPDNRRNDRITWNATAHRGNNGRAYDFEIRCSVDLNKGSIRSIQVKRR